MHVLIDDAQYQIIKATPGLEDAARRYEEARRQLTEHAGVIEEARVTYAMGSDDDLEIDDEPILSIADNGIWVSAWVWIRTRD